jgi:hypothetical protein
MRTTNSSLFLLLLQVNLKLAEHAKAFHSLAQQAMGQQQQGGPRQQQQQQGWGGGTGAPKQQYARQQQQQQGGAGHLQALCNRNGMQYHPNATLTVYQRSSNSTMFGGRGRGRGRGRRGGRGRDADSDAEEGEDQQQQQKQESMFLTLPPGKMDRRKFR